MRVLIATRWTGRGAKKTVPTKPPDLSRHLPIRGKHQKINPSVVRSRPAIGKMENFAPQRKNTLLKKIYYRKQK